jgi:hypothetical protein
MGSCGGETTFDGAAGSSLVWTGPDTSFSIGFAAVLGWREVLFRLDEVGSRVNVIEEDDREISVLSEGGDFDVSYATDRGRWIVFGGDFDMPRGRIG